MALNLTDIPADLGVAGAHLAKGGAAGSPDLNELLVEHKTALETLETAVNDADAGARVYASPVADFTALKAIAAADRANGTQALKLDDGSLWRFASASTLTGDDLLVATPAAGTGRWLRADRIVDLKLPVVYTAADAAVLYTVPAGFRLRPTVPFWEVTTAFTTGASGAAGVSSSNAAASTKGDLLGGASLDAAASLTLGLIGGTVGAVIGAPATVLVGGNTILWDKTSTFTAGAGFAHIPVEVILAPAA
jgi:hypothetical protein